VRLGLPCGRLPGEDRAAVGAKESPVMAHEDRCRACTSLKRLWQWRFLIDGLVVPSSKAD
jgi:hypothetical protein